MLGASLILVQGAGAMLAAAPGTHEDAARVVSTVAVSCAATRRQPLPAPERSVVLSLTHGGLLTVAEHGQEIAVRAGDVVEISTPPRLGKFSVLLAAAGNVEIRRARPGAGHGYVEVTLDCAPDDETLRLRVWQAKVQELEKRIAAPMPSAAFERLVPQLDAIRAGAPSGYPRVLADQVRALSLLKIGRAHV